MVVRPGIVRIGHTAFRLPGSEVFKMLSIFAALDVKSDGTGFVGCRPGDEGGLMLKLNIEADKGQGQGDQGRRKDISILKDDVIKGVVPCIIDMDAVADLESRL